VRIEDERRDRPQVRPYLAFLPVANARSSGDTQNQFRRRAHRARAVRRRNDHNLSDPHDDVGQLQFDDTDSRNPIPTPEADRFSSRHANAVASLQTSSRRVS